MSESYDEMWERHGRQRQEQLDQSKPYVSGPFRPGSYSLSQRGSHHFDVYAERRPGYVQWFYEENPDCISWPMANGLQERAFAIRGKPRRIYILDERWDKERPQPRGGITGFRSAEEAVAWVHGELVG